MEETKVNDVSVANDNVVTLQDKVATDTMNEVFAQEEAPVVGLPNGFGSMPLVSDNSNIENWLSRPVSIGTYNWTVGTEPYFTVDPWTAFLTNSAVADKIRNYSRLRGDLVLRINVSGTPYHYGMFYLSYRPHPGLGATEDTIYNLAVDNSGTDTHLLKRVHSQLPHVANNPCMSSAAELRCPYIHHIPGIEVGDTASYSRIGTVAIIGVTDLRHANLGTDAAEIQIYAHMENVTLDVPTVTAQGFTLREAAEKGVNIIRSGMKATQAAGEWVPRVASALAALGFSRPLVAEHPVSVRQLPYNLANYDLDDTAERLALSASSEAVISGEAVGVGPEDPLMLSSMAARDGFLTTFNWTVGDAAGDFKFASVVTPQLGITDTYAPPGHQSVERVMNIPCSFVASMFTHASFEMVFTVNVVASPYHKGRLRIWYDPEPKTFSTPGINLVNGYVLDLAECSSIEVRVPWQNVRDSVRMSENLFVDRFSTAEAFWNIISATNTRETCNGMLCVEVLNKLTAPSSTPVDVVISARAENFAGYGPRLPRSGKSVVASCGLSVPWTPVGLEDGSLYNAKVVTLHGDDGVIHIPEGEEFPEGEYYLDCDINGLPLSYRSDTGPPLICSYQSYDPSCGDAVASLRQLMKRYNKEYQCAVRNSISGAGASREVSVYLPIYMPPPGRQAGTTDTLDLDSNGGRVSYTSWSFRTLISQAFALARGSVRYKITTSVYNNSDTVTSDTQVARVHGDLTPYGLLYRRRATVFHSDGVGYVSESLCARSGFEDGGNSDEGAQYCLSPDGGTLDVEFPFVSMYRGYNPRGKIDTGAQDDRDKMNFVVTTVLHSDLEDSNAIHRLYSAAGEDYNVFCFLHAPSFLDGIPEPTP